MKQIIIVSFFFEVATRGHCVPRVAFLSGEKFSLFLFVFTNRKISVIIAVYKHMGEMLCL